MEDEVGGPLISTNLSDVSYHYNMSTLPSVFSEIPIKNKNVMEANDLLRNGILIETSKGVEWLSLTDALSSGVGGLNLSVEDFQNVAAQLLSTHQVVNNDLITDSESKLKSATSEDTTNIRHVQPCLSVAQTSLKLESIEESAEHLNESEVEESNNIEQLTDKSIRLKSKTGLQKQQLSDSSLCVTLSESTNSDSSSQSAPVMQVKKKGGWPKGRKRKPESENRPPKAPSTGYVFYLNEKRKLPAFKDIPFHEVTKLLGNEWSKLNLSQKRAYLELAEIDKKRYREELRVYRNSDAYQAYLRRKRIKSLQANGTEESDIDATDEIEDEEENEELYCRLCDQWFTSLHNKKEHLYGRQHFQSISQLGNIRQGVLPDAYSALSLDESSLDAAPLPRNRAQEPNPSSVTDAMASFLYIFSEREREIMILQQSLKNLLLRTNRS